MSIAVHLCQKKLNDRSAESRALNRRCCQASLDPGYRLGFQVFIGAPRKDALELPVEKLLERNVDSSTSINIRWSQRLCLN